MDERNPRPTRAITDLAALRHNLDALRGRLADGTRMCLVVKANAYGHGMLPVAQAAVDHGVEMLAVATAWEGVELRAAGIDAPILVVGPWSEHELDLVFRYDLQLTVASREGARVLATWAMGDGRVAPVHARIDTGMGAYGLNPETAVPVICDIAASEGLQLAGVYTHFPSAEEIDDAYTRDQISLFASLVAAIRERGVDPGIVHAANGEAVVNYPESQLDMVRVGLAAYGIRLAPEFGPDLDLQPVLQFESEITHLARQPAGKPLSYSRTYVVPEDTLIATVPAGYGDGVPWAVANRGMEVLVRKHRVPIVGRVCMDMLLLDVGDVDDVSVGDAVTLIGKQGRKRVTVEEWAEAAGTSPYEIPCRITPRVPRDFRG